MGTKFDQTAESICGSKSVAGDWSVCNGDDSSLLAPEGKVSADGGPVMAGIIILKLIFMMLTIYLI